MEEEGGINEFINKFKLPLILTLVGGVLLIGGIFTSGILPQTFSKSKPASPTNSSYSPSVIKVDVSGAVKSPGVYTLNSDSRVEEAIIAAGGVTEEVDKEYLSKRITLAQKVSDGMKIYIPKIGENVQGVVSTQTTIIGGTAGVSIISINTAQISELDTLPGIGPVTAQKIIDNRPYGDISDLINKKVVSRGVFEKIKDKISL